MNRISLPIRTEFGFQRTTCACELCSFWCRIMVPSDLQRLCPPGADLMTWAKEHLRASQGFRVVNPMTGAMLQIPSLVPAKQANGHCHWLQPDGRCGVHENSPFGWPKNEMTLDGSLAVKISMRMAHIPRSGGC